MRLIKKWLRKPVQPLTLPVTRPKSGTSTAGPFCAGCGKPRCDQAGLPAAERAPCLDCGNTALNWTVHAWDTVTATATVSASLRPGDQSNDWRKRWATLEADLTKVTGVLTIPLSSESIRTAERELMQFLGSCYHLKDILKADQVLPSKDVEHAITNTPALALLADLANLDKHHVLTNDPRSAHKPVYQERTGSTATGGGWTVHVMFEHGPSLVDAAKVARDAMAEWRAFLVQRGLLQ